MCVGGGLLRLDLKDSRWGGGGGGGGDVRFEGVQMGEM